MEIFIGLEWTRLPKTSPTIRLGCRKRRCPIPSHGFIIILPTFQWPRIRFLVAWISQKTSPAHVWPGTCLWMVWMVSHFNGSNPTISVDSKYMYAVVKTRVDFQYWGMVIHPLVGICIYRHISYIYIYTVDTYMYIHWIHWNESPMMVRWLYPFVLDISPKHLDDRA